MAPRDFVDYLDDILDGIEKVEQFTKGTEFEDFRWDDKTTFAVIRALEIIGEASRRVPQPVRVKYAFLPWQDMADMRNKLIHEYFGVDIAIVWKTVQEDLPAVKPLIRRVLAEARRERTSDS